MHWKMTSTSSHPHPTDLSQALLRPSCAHAASGIFSAGAQKTASLRYALLDAPPAMGWTPPWPGCQGAGTTADSPPMPPGNPSTLSTQGACSHVTCTYPCALLWAARFMMMCDDSASALACHCLRWTCVNIRVATLPLCLHAPTGAHARVRWPAPIGVQSLTVLMCLWGREKGGCPGLIYYI